MKIDYNNTNNSFRGVFNTIVCMRNHVFVIILLIVFLCVFLSGQSSAGTWTDEFNQVELNGWKRIADENPWHAQWILISDDGKLFAQIFQSDKEDTAADFLHWNIHDFQLKHLTVVGEEIRYNRHADNRSGELCLFLGKKQNAPNFVKGYIFSPEKITKMQFNVNGVYTIGEVKVDYSLMFRLTSGHIKVVFDTGKFRLFTQDLLIEKFTDADINIVDVIGLIVLHKFPGEWFKGSISTFSVSGQGIPNNNTLNLQMQSTQLTTTWGELKRF